MTETVLLVAVLVPSVILHEVAHGLVAFRFGDDTARQAGRLTLNPVRHIDPFGTVILPTLLALSGAGTFGYAKPVPVRTDRLRRPRDHGLLVSLAGPATNIVLAVLAAVVLRALGGTDGSLTSRALVAFGVVNVVLAAFNLLPVPPLDGSAVIERFLPGRALAGWSRLRGYAMPLVLLVVLVFPRALQRVFRVAVELWSTLLG